MRKLLLPSAIGVFIFINSGCKKAVHSESEVTVQVKEAGTNTPVEGVTLSLLRCFLFEDCAWGRITEYTGVTDNTGVCKIPKNVWDSKKGSTDILEISKQGYQTQESGKSTTLHIAPEGWIRLQTKIVGNYPEESILDIRVIPQISVTSILPVFLGTGSDNSVLIKAFGNQTNRINWKVMQGGATTLNNGALNAKVPKHDTVNVVLNY